jgi:hypothetical protein
MMQILTVAISESSKGDGRHMAKKENPPTDPVTEAQAALDDVRARLAQIERDQARDDLDRAELEAKREALLKRGARGESITNEQRQIRTALQTLDDQATDRTELRAFLEREVEAREQRLADAHVEAEAIKVRELQGPFDQALVDLDAALRAVETQWLQAGLLAIRLQAAGHDYEIKQLNRLGFKMYSGSELFPGGPEQIVMPQCAHLVSGISQTTAR